MDKDMIIIILEKQAGKCGSPLVPCIVCNADGRCPSPKPNHEPSFWETVGVLHLGDSATNPDQK